MTTRIGIPLDQAQPGDIVAYETPGDFGRLIGVYQTLRRDLKPYSKWHHIAVVVEAGAGVKTKVVQAARRADTVGILEPVSDEDDIIVLPCPPGVDRAKVVEQANALVGSNYAVLSILSIVALYPLKLSLRRDGTWICSAAGAECLHAGGFIYPWRDMATVVPAELVRALVRTLYPELAAQLEAAA